MRTSRAAVAAVRTDLFARADAIFKAKSADYGAADDGLANFRHAAAAGVSTPQAVFSRLADKFHRLGKAASGAALEVEDNDIPDAINLLAFLQVALAETRSQ